MNKIFMDLPTRTIHSVKNHGDECGTMHVMKTSNDHLGRNHPRIMIITMRILFVIIILSVISLPFMPTGADNGYTVTLIKDTGALYSTQDTSLSDDIHTTPSWKKVDDQTIIVQMKTWKDCTPTLTVSSHTSEDEILTTIKAEYPDSSIRSCLQKDDVKEQKLTWRQWKIHGNRTVSTEDSLKQRIVHVVMRNGQNGGLREEKFELIEYSTFGHKK